MSAHVTRVREVGKGLGYEVVTHTALGRRSMAFKLHAADANIVAQEVHARQLLMHDAVTDAIGEQCGAPILELWEAAA